MDGRRSAVRKYLSAIGRKGGLAGKRALAPEEARAMVKIREARRAYRKYHAQCFWSYRPDLRIGAQDIPWVAERLMKQGGQEAWRAGAKLCR
jgi:hypothetical protein